MAYGNDEGRLKRVRGFALGLFGTFIFAFSSVAVVSRLDSSYLVIGALSGVTLVLVAQATRSNVHFNSMLYVIMAGAALATEASSIMMYFGSEYAMAYAVITLLGGGLALKGVIDIQVAQPSDYYYWRSKKEREKTNTRVPD